MVLAVGHLPCCFSRTVLEGDCLVLPGRLSLGELEMVLDGTLRLRVVHEAAIGDPVSLPAMRVLSLQFPLQGLHIRTLGCLHEDRDWIRIILLNVLFPFVLDYSELAIILSRPFAALSFSLGESLLSCFVNNVTLVVSHTLLSPVLRLGLITALVLLIADMVFSALLLVLVSERLLYKNSRYITYSILSGST